jgi:hypothetical protein
MYTSRYLLSHLLSPLLVTLPLSVGTLFRLTDPPGLKTILECAAKESFHPHPDIPIYTVSLFLSLYGDVS